MMNAWVLIIVITRVAVRAVGMVGVVSAIMIAIAAAMLSTTKHNTRAPFFTNAVYFIHSMDK